MRKRRHRVDGAARTWCGIVLDGVPAPDAIAAYVKGRDRRVDVDMKGDAFDCKGCKRHARRLQRFVDIAATERAKHATLRDYLNGVAHKIARANQWIVTEGHDFSRAEDARSRQFWGVTCAAYEAFFGEEPGDLERRAPTWRAA
jgi:hypothetical protein